jgi:hypothetical protein
MEHGLYSTRGHLQSDIAFGVIYHLRFHHTIQLWNIQKVALSKLSKTTLPPLNLPEVAKNIKICQNEDACEQ